MKREPVFPKLGPSSDADTLVDPCVDSGLAASCLQNPACLKIVALKTGDSRSHHENSRGRCERRRISAPQSAGESSLGDSSRVFERSGVGLEKPRRWGFGPPFTCYHPAQLARVQPKSVQLRLKP